MAEKDIPSDQKGNITMCDVLDRAIEEGRQEGISLGRQEGISQGEEKTSRLFSCLIRDNRLDDMKKAVSDKDFRHELFLFYHLTDD
jgi:hypothetical protein